MTVDPRIARLRGEIDALDVEIVRAVNARLELVRQLWDVKHEAGAPLVDADRERQIRERLDAVNDGSLTSVGLEELIEALLQLTKREQARRRPDG